jgi:hypothetical protein
MKHIDCAEKEEPREKSRDRAGTDADQPPYGAY